MAGNVLLMLERWSWLLIFLLLGGSVAAWGDEMPGYQPLDKGAKAPVIKIAGELEEQFVRRGIRFNDAELQEILDRVAESVVPARSTSSAWPWRTRCRQRPDTAPQ